MVTYAPATGYGRLDLQTIRDNIEYHERSIVRMLSNKPTNWSNIRASNQRIEELRLRLFELTEEEEMEMEKNPPDYPDSDMYS